jgi:alpha-galactosidase
VIAVDQHSTEGHPVITTPSTVVWVARTAEGNGRYIAVFNVGDTAQTIGRTWKDLELNGAAYNVRDLWEHKDLGSAASLKVRLQPHASVLYRLTRPKAN